MGNEALQNTSLWKASVPNRNEAYSYLWAQYHCATEISQLYISAAAQCWPKSLWSSFSIGISYGARNPICPIWSSARSKGCWFPLWENTTLNPLFLTFLFKVLFTTPTQTTVLYQFLNHLFSISKSLNTGNLIFFHFLDGTSAHEANVLVSSSWRIKELETPTLL